MLGMANKFDSRPSTLLAVEDEYTAYCLDEAAAYVISKIEDGEEPVFEKKVEKHFKSMREMYDYLGV